MTKLFDLVRNELAKIYVLKSTWVMYLFLVALVIFSLIMNTVTDSVDSETTYSGDWETELQEENQTLMEQIETEGEDDPFIESTNMALIRECLPS